MPRITKGSGRRDPETLRGMGNVKRNDLSREVENRGGEKKRMTMQSGVWEKNQQPLCTRMWKTGQSKPQNYQKVTRE